MTAVLHMPAFNVAPHASAFTSVNGPSSVSPTDEQKPTIVTATSSTSLPQPLVETAALTAPTNGSAPSVKTTTTPSIAQIGNYHRLIRLLPSKTDHAELCKQMLAVVALVYRPIPLKELVTLVEPLEGMADDTELREIIGLCCSFLTLRQQTVYFVHQPAKDFPLAKAAQDIFPAGRETVHQAIFARSLQIISTTLRRDMYGLKALGTPIDDVEVPALDPLAALRYSCVHWVDHLCASNTTSSATYAECLQDRGVVDRFLREKCLPWLESLSLCKSMSKGIVSVRELQMLVQGQGEATPFTQLVYDVYRFVMYSKQAIESNPLQAYGSGLLFSPKQSVVRKLFQHEGLEGIALKPGMSDGWSACLQTLEGHSSEVSSVAFSHDSTRLASASWDSTVKMWDASSGACLQTLDVSRSLFSLSFDATGSCLLTEIGSIDVSASIGSGAENVTVLQRPQYLDAGVSSDNTWITYNVKNLLWIPPEYRPFCSAVCRNVIGMGVGSGRVWVCSINL